MDRYESLIIIEKSTNEKEIENIIKNTVDLINENGKAKVKSVKNRGIMELVPKKKGYVIIFVFYTTLDVATKVELSYKKYEKIIYELTIKNNPNPRTKNNRYTLKGEFNNG